MNNQISLLKKKQRVFLEKKRQNINKKLTTFNKYFFNKLLSYNWFSTTNVVASFISIKSEIQTSYLNEFIQKKGKILCLPVVKDKNNGKLIFKSYLKGDQLIKGKFNIMEPKNNNVYLPDIIFAPCLGFDLRGYRLGYGGGFYDKTISYLHSVNHSFLTIGLAYDEQKVDKIIQDHNDQKLNFILTEKQLYEIL